MDFDPKNNIWRAGTQGEADERVFSSARMSEIAPDDPEIEAFEAAGGDVTTWPRDANGDQTQEALDDVLRAYGLLLTEAPSPSLPDISPRQFAMGLWTDKIITFAECDAYIAARSLPQALQDVLDALPDDDTGDPTPRKDATLLLKGATSFEFDHPLVETIRLGREGWTHERLAERWTAWAAL